MSKTFKRIEKKYLLEEAQFQALFDKLTSEFDFAVDNYGEQAICNIYFDTDSFYLIRHSLDKPKYKEKLRLRSYGIPNADSKVFLELKKKYDGVVYKRRIEGKYSDILSYIGGVDNLPASQIKRELDYFLKLYRPTPKVYLAYDRIALFRKSGPSFRLTFDSHIRSRDENVDFAFGDYGKELLTNGQHLMEIKTSGALPLPLVKLLESLQIYPASFSKYGEVYKRQLSSHTIKSPIFTTERRQYPAIQTENSVFQF